MQFTRMLFSARKLHHSEEFVVGFFESMKSEDSSRNYKHFLVKGGEVAIAY